jgi:WS/DGAT/MGAT family acyltransferase
MQRLSGLDAAFLSMETASAHMHVLGVAVVDPSSAPEPFTFERVRTLVSTRMPLIPAFRRRLVTVPFDVHHPLWVEDPGFDLDFHTRRVALPAPGGPVELAEFVADVAGRALDRSKPLWELWFVEGLEGGHVAIVAKVHHAAIDGVAGVGILATLFDLSPDAPLRPDDLPEAPRPDHVPNDVELLGFGLWSLARQPVSLLRNLARLAGSATRVARRVLGESLQVTTPLTAPRLAMNAAITPHRKVAFCSVPLAEVKAVKQAFGVTVNDVVLAVAAGALRSYLASRNELPGRPLVAAIPASVRADDTTEAHGNQVSAMFAALPVDVEDPVERLLATQQSAHAAKQVHEELGGSTLQEWAELAAPVVFGRAVRAYSSLRIAERHRPIISLVVSNVPGPPFPLYIAGARLVSIHPLGPIFDGCGLNLTVMSYLDKVDFGFLACRELVPDVDALAAAVPDALTELQKVTAAR